jgi:cytochrome c oxidase subunit II
MGYLIGFLIFALIVIILLQVSKISAVADTIRGEEDSFYAKNNATAFWMVIFVIAFLVISAVSAYYYRNYMLGYGPWASSSEHGGSIDSMFNVTLVLTGIVFVITQILTFWYAFKYRQKKGGKAQFFAHDLKLELVWTAIPAIVMAFLVAKGLVVWNDVMTDLDPNESYMEIEATGYQFAWDVRYGGADGRVGKKDFRLIDMASNSLGMDFTDDRNHDDIFLGGSDKLVLPVDTTVRVQITSKDVLHNFYLPHFRVKMDAVPGLPTYFIFKPTKTTAQMRQELKKYDEWNLPADPADPEGPKRYETFEYELACAELCGKGHYSMRRIVEIVDRDTYKKWVAEQPSFYLSKIRRTDADPNKDKRLLPMEIKAREKELNKEVKSAVEMSKDTSAKEEAIVRMKNLFFETGSSKLEADSYFELDHTARLLNKYNDVMLEIGGHTDNVGDPALNRTLSQQRAESVKARLIEKGVSAARLISAGYGDTKPVETNDTDEGKAKNRRTELKVIAKN